MNQQEYRTTAYQLISLIVHKFGVGEAAIDTACEDVMLRLYAVAAHHRITASTAAALYDVGLTSEQYNTALAALYPGSGLREMSDIDFFVDTDDFEKIKSAMSMPDYTAVY